MENPWLGVDYADVRVNEDRGTKGSRQGQEREIKIKKHVKEKKQR
jgi:hypothetical protein